MRCIGWSQRCETSWERAVFGAVPRISKSDAARQWQHHKSYQKYLDYYATACIRIISLVWSTTAKCGTAYFRHVVMGRITCARMHYAQACVYAYVRVCVCMCPYMYECVYIHIYMLPYVYMCVCTHMQMSPCLYMYTECACTSIYLSLYLSIPLPFHLPTYFLAVDSFTHSLTHAEIHALIHAFIHSLLNHWVTSFHLSFVALPFHAPIHTIIHTFNRSCMLSLCTCSFIRSFIHSLFKQHWFIHSVGQSCIHPFHALMKCLSVCEWIFARMYQLQDAAMNLSCVFCILN